MVNKCVAHGCKTGYDSEFSSVNNKISAFTFPLDNPDLLAKWIQFTNRKDWKPSSSSVLCIKHFDSKYIKYGKRNKLKWELNPIPTIHSQKTLEKQPSLLPNISAPRKPPKVRKTDVEDPFQEFLRKDKISSLSDINKSHCPDGFEYAQQNNNNVVFYKIYFDKQTYFPSVIQAIKIDENLNVQLQFKCNPVPLPQWFVVGHNAKLTKFSMLQNFPNYLNTFMENHNESLLSQLEKRQHYKPTGRPSYSTEIIRFALLVRYTSSQAYRILLKYLPLPSFSLLTKLHTGGIDSMKAAEKLLTSNNISSDVILMCDEMYLAREAQYHSGDFVGANDNNELYKGIVVFMITGMQKSIPFVIKACPEISVNGAWLSENMDECISSLSKIGFNVVGIVTDNHSANVNAFQRLLKKYPSQNNLYIKHPHSSKNTFIFFDTVHLLKNIRNNLLNTKKFVFPEFSFEIMGEVISSPPGYITWQDLHRIHDKDQCLTANLRKAPKLSYKALHPGNNKQNVDLALSIIHDTTIAAAKSYFPDRKDISGFLQLINCWWEIANSIHKHSPNKFRIAVGEGDGKMQFYRNFANWIESWSKSPNFCLTKQTGNALIRTLRSQADLIDSLLKEGYEFVLTRKLQSDPIEKRFSQYRQMSGGRFLVSLREVITSERILKCRSLIKADINFWNEDLSEPVVCNFDLLLEKLKVIETEILFSELSDDSEEVAITVTGYISKKLKKRTKCNSCHLKLQEIDEAAKKKCKYFNILSRGGLTFPSPDLIEYVCGCFAILDCTTNLIKSEANIPTRKAADFVLSNYSPKCVFTCCDHEQWGYHFAKKIIINIFFNNEQHLTSDSVRKDEVVSFKSRQRPCK